MFILAYYLYTGTQHAERRIPGFVAGVVDCMLMFGFLWILTLV